MGWALPRVKRRSCIGSARRLECRIGCCARPQRDHESGRPLLAVSGNSHGMTSPTRYTEPRISAAWLMPPNALIMDPAMMGKTYATRRAALKIKLTAVDRTVDVKSSVG